MDVIGVAVKLMVVATNYFAKGEHVEDEAEGAKHRTLGDALGQRSGGGGAVVDVDKLMSVGEVGFQPGEFKGALLELSLSCSVFYRF